MLRKSGLDVNCNEKMKKCLLFLNISCNKKNEDMSTRFIAICIKKVVGYIYNQKVIFHKMDSKDDCC